MTDDHPDILSAAGEILKRLQGEAQRQTLSSALGTWNSGAARLHAAGAVDGSARIDVLARGLREIADEIVARVARLQTAADDDRERGDHCDHVDCYRCDYVWSSCSCDADLAEQSCAGTVRISWGRTVKMNPGVVKK